LARTPDYDPLWVKCRQFDPAALTGWAMAHTLPAVPPGFSWRHFAFRRGFPWGVAAEADGVGDRLPQLPPAAPGPAPRLAHRHPPHPLPPRPRRAGRLPPPRPPPPAGVLDRAVRRRRPRPARRFAARRTPGRTRVHARWDRRRRAPGPRRLPAVPPAGGARTG